MKALHNSVFRTQDPVGLVSKKEGNERISILNGKTQWKQRYVVGNSKDLGLTVVVKSLCVPINFYLGT